MEQHPVPQNIIEVEFKLFGSFTLKQFSKIVIGCLGAVVIYLLPVIPVLIKVPLVILSVGVGIMMAIVPSFGVWLNGFVKSLFISPRYVWMKKENTPELLQSKQVLTEVQKAQKVESLNNKQKIDITDVPLDKLFGTKVDDREYVEMENQYENDPVRNSNLDRMYSAEFAKGNPQTPQQAAQQPAVAPQVQQVTTIQQYQQQIQQLKTELARLNKDENYKAHEQEIIAKINDIYREVKLLQMNTQQHPQNHPIQSNVTKGRVVSVSPIERNVKNIFGIVVDKNDAPISQAGVIFENETDGSTYRTISSVDGRFATQEIPVGKYNVKIEQPSYKFHTYEIDIKDQNLPAYKFRER